MAVALTVKLSSMAGCSPALLGSSSTSKTPPPRLVSSRATPSYFTRFSCSSSSLALSAFFLSWTKNKVPMSLCTVAKTSNLAWQDEEEVSGWRGREEAEEEIQEEEGFAGVETEEEGFPEPPAEAKLFVGNLPYDVDSEKLAHLFEKGGMVEISEVIYSRETGQSRGFGFVTMSTVEEAKNAVEMFHRYDLNGRLLTVNTAAPRGSLPEKPPPGDYEPSFRIYVGNLPWQVDCAGLEQIFSEHGKVLNARVVYDRETGRSRGFGFVSMSSQSELDDAIAALDGQSLDGRSIRVCVAEERPRRGSF